MGDADFVKGRSDRLQRVLDSRGGSMVVDDKGHPIFGACQGRSQSARSNHLGFEELIQTPPDIF